MRVYEGGDYLTILDLYSRGLRRLVENGGQIYWNRQGEWRRIPNAILKQELATYDMWTKNRPDKWTMKPPALVGLLFWDQGIPVDKWDLPGEKLNNKETRVRNKTDNGTNQ